MERIESVPADSIYYHSVRALLRRRVVTTPYADDFASWISTEVRDPLLAERLALHSPFDFPDLEAFREELLSLIDDHLSSLSFTPRVQVGEPFHFLRGHLFAVPLEVEARTLEEFRHALAAAEESTIYFHTVEAVGRLERRANDFSVWIETGLGLPRLAEAIRNIDPFVCDLGRVRAHVLELVDAAIESRAGSPG